MMKRIFNGPLKRLIPAWLIFIGGAGLLLDARADGEKVGDAQPLAIATAGSDASFDKRLPPALPGETVADSGKTMKLWTTSGPVPVAPAPEPFDRCRGANARGCAGTTDSGLPPNANIVVDARKEAPTQENRETSGR